MTLSPHSRTMRSSYLGTRHPGRCWRWRIHDCDVCREDWWLRLCNSSSSGPSSPCVSWHWCGGPWLCVLSLHGSWEMRTWQISHFQPRPWLFRGTKGPIFLAPPSQQGGSCSPLPSAASPHPPHRNHKFTVGLSRSPPILLSCYLPRLAAYLGAWGWLSATAELALCRDQTLSCCLG